MESIYRIKRDDGSYAKDFGGPVAQASGPESGESEGTEVPEVPTVAGSSPSGVPTVATVPLSAGVPSSTVVPGVTPLPSPRPTVPPLAETCTFDRIADKVLAIVVASITPPSQPYGVSSYVPTAPPVVPSGYGSVPQVPAPAPYLTNTVLPAIVSVPSAYGNAPQVPAPYVANATIPPAIISAGIQAAAYAVHSRGLIRKRETFGQKFRLLNSMSCETPETCFTMCENLVICNYFVRSVINFDSYLFEVQQSVLDEANYTDAPNYECYTKTCGPCLKFIPDKIARPQFENYLKTFNEKYGDENSPDKGPKTYASDAELQQRYQTFKDSLQIIQKLNCESKGEGAIAEITEFGDQTHAEFMSSSTGSLLEIADGSTLDNSDVGTKRIVKCPKWNWPDIGVVPAPRKQGKCGACYAFSTSDLIASQYHIDRKLKGKTFNLAPQYFVDCMKDPAGLGCDGGRPIEVLRNLTVCTNARGCNVPKEECYPYKGKKQQCQQEACQETPKIPIRFATVSDLSGPDEKEKIAALLHWGPAVVIIDASHSWQHYGGRGILRSTQCGKTQNHAVLLVGYDYSGPVPYYIIKNSWGTKWGAKGFIKLEAGKNTCSVAKTLTFCCTHNCDSFRDATSLANKPNSEGCD